MRIVYILPTLEPSGGAERIITEKANYFANIFHYDIYIINLFQHKNISCFYPISEKVKIINLGIPYFSQYNYKYPKRLWIKIKTNHYLKKTVTNEVNKIDPDILIGVSYSQADKICSIKCRAKKIIECHEPRYLYSSSLYKSSIFSKIYTNYFYFRSIENKADLVVTLTLETKQQWKRAKRVEFIPNFSSIPVTQKSGNDTKRIIAVGRLREEKGFERLLDIWKYVNARHKEWKLDIFGEGILKEKLVDIINTEHIENVRLHGATQNIGQEYANSSICCVTSHYEGFSLVILEAMEHGVPCIAYDCPYGPRSIIENNQCGYLIEDGDKESYIKKLCTLIEDDQLRKQFSDAAIKRSMQFDTDTIMNQWRALFEQLTNNQNSH